jgi:vancomycin resistance protein YoaR
MRYLCILGLIFLTLPIHANASESLLILHDQEPFVRINRADFSLPIVGYPFIDTDEFIHLTEELDKHVRQPAIDAKIDESGRIIPERAGVELNKNKFEEEFYSFFHNQNRSTIELPVRSIYPRVDSELLANIRTKPIGHYVTYFNSRNEERSHNIRLASEAINNHVVFPGETFSFNETVGMRTKEKGYLPAPIIVRGELSEGIGGGICQVSSTLFNAADRSGLQIVKRYSHSKRVPYVPPGRDATVSWYGPDFSFKNLYNQPVLIKAQVNGGIMAVMMFSSDDINVQPRQIPSMGYYK